jgi:hypothetical protein
MTGTVVELKRKISSTTGMSVDKCELLYGHQRFNYDDDQPRLSVLAPDNATLDSLGIPAYATVHTRMRIKGGGGSSSPSAFGQGAVIHPVQSPLGAGIAPAPAARVQAAANALTDRAAAAPAEAVRERVLFCIFRGDKPGVEVQSEHLGVHAAASRRDAKLG